MSTIQQDFSVEDFDAIKIAVASPDDIANWSYGEVLKPETINYRTQKPEREGLFDEKIFGPIKDYECYCGKYKKIRYKGIVCDKCGVEITRSVVRRERMGHIELAVPVTHIWYVHGIPSMLGLTLDMSMADLQKIIYFNSYVILKVDEKLRKSILDDLHKEYEELKSKKTVEKTQLDGQFKKIKKDIEQLSVGGLLSENEFHEISLRYGNLIEVGIGAEALYTLLQSIDVDKTIKALQEEAKKKGSNLRKVLRRLRLFNGFKKAGILPEWLVLKRLPVLPPDLRPMVQLDGGRFATSDLNDLYRRVINRNNRLKKLINQGAPEVITRNEKRMLQEAVDALIDNTARYGKNTQNVGAGARKLRSLSDMLRGKQGRFRQNLLGKRVDYSGRSVIVAGPQLKLNQCGLPTVMAIEMFKPFVISKLISEGYAHNVKNASKLIEQGEPEVWDILERITSKSYILLNRAPTLHRLGIEAFQPVLIDGKAIQVHPLVCYAFNADFDGDQMAVHLPLSEHACLEAKNIIQATKNLLKPASGEPVVHARMDIVLGCYYLTSFKENAQGEGKQFASKNEAIMAFQSENVDIRAKIKVRINQKITETTVGRILFNNILPKKYPFVNKVLDSKELKRILSKVYYEFGVDETVSFVDRMKDIGFKYAALSGITISVDDVYTPPEKEKIISDGDKQVEIVEKQYRRGLITAEEKDYRLIAIWQKAKDDIQKLMLKGYDRENSINIMVSSGARGSIAQVIQMGGMKGLVVNPSGQIITLPVRDNFKEGLSSYEYFISTHGARKGRSDTSLRTSDAGYLTRRLVDVSQDNVITSDDCKTTEGITLTASSDEEFGESLDTKIIGRVALKDIGSGGKIIVKKGKIVTQERAKEIVDRGIDEVEVRSPITCKNTRGICKKCYGVDLATGKEVEVGTAVGIIAAQAIGEPGTQLTMKTFHLGGVSGASDITSGLPRVEELFEARTPKHPAIISEIDGKVKITEKKEQLLITVTSSKQKRAEISIPKGYKLEVKSGDKVKEKQTIASIEKGKLIRASCSGVVKVRGGKVIIEDNIKESIEYVTSPDANVIVKNNSEVKKGDLLTDDHRNLALSLKFRGVKETQTYIIEEIQKIYRSQGQDINDKHIELIVREMFSKVKITNGGDSGYLAGQIVDLDEVVAKNKELTKKKKKTADYERIVLGISRVALKTDSFLAAASFQETTGILLESAVKGAVDTLKGLKENVIIGRLIPAGTGLVGIKEFKGDKDANS